jgi:hypothetical protein
MEVALVKEQSLQHGESIDQYMNTNHCISTMDNIDQQRLKEIELLDKSDPSYAKKVREIESRAK